MTRGAEWGVDGLKAEPRRSGQMLLFLREPRNPSLNCHHCTAGSTTWLVVQGSLSVTTSGMNGVEIGQCSGMSRPEQGMEWGQASWEVSGCLGLEVGFLTGFPLAGVLPSRGLVGCLVGRRIMTLGLKVWISGGKIVGPCGRPWQSPARESREPPVALRVELC